MTLEEAASSGVVGAAERFLLAVLYGDRRAMWGMFSRAARQYIVDRGVKQGLDPALGQELLAGTASEHEQELFLTDVLYGLRKDLEHVDLSALALDAVAELHGPLQMRVTFLQALGSDLGPPLPAFPAGTLLMSFEEEQWKVERLAQMGRR